MATLLAAIAAAKENKEQQEMPRIGATREGKDALVLVAVFGCYYRTPGNGLWYAHGEDTAEMLLALKHAGFEPGADIWVTQGQERKKTHDRKVPKSV